MKQVKAMLLSLQESKGEKMADVVIVSENGNNNVVAEYNGVRCTAIFNPFSGLYYVDDVYGVIGKGGGE